MKQTCRLLGCLTLVSTGHLASAADFSDELKAAHPCLGVAALPAKILPAERSTLPAEFSHWAGLYAGDWVGANGKMCHVLVIERIEPSGKVRLLYSTGSPYKEFASFDGSIEKNGTEQVLTTKLRNGVVVKYVLASNGAEPGKSVLNGSYGTSVGGTFKPVLVGN